MGVPPIIHGQKETFCTLEIYYTDMVLSMPHNWCVFIRPLGSSAIGNDLNVLYHFCGIKVYLKMENFRFANCVDQK